MTDLAPLETLIDGYWDERASLSPGNCPAELARALETAIDWLGTGAAELPYRAEVDGDEWMVRVNDWPQTTTVYTLFVNGREAFSFDGWPDTWSRP